MTRNILYPNSCVPVFQNKQRQNTIEIISALALLGPSTTHDMAKFIIKHNTRSKYLNYRDVKKRAGTIYQRIKDRSIKNKNYLGLVSSGYLFKVGEKINSKNLGVSYYFLTLKSYFLLLGFEFTNQELQCFIDNAARNSVFFGYLRKIMKETSVSFVKELFIIPIQNEIKKGKIILDDDIRFYFGVIPDLLSHSFVMMNTNNRFLKYPQFQDVLRNLSMPESTYEWKRWIMRTFYPDVSERKFLEHYFKEKGDKEYILLNRVMTEISKHVN